jgi:hypothetical protein
MARKPEFPPHPIGRLVASTRYSALLAPLSDDISPEVRTLLGNLRKDFLSREDVAQIANLLTECEPPRIKRARIVVEDVARIERSGDTPEIEKIYWILRGCLVSHSDALVLLENPGLPSGLSNLSGTNAHLINGDVRLRYAGAEFGALITGTIAIHGLRTTWVDVASAGVGGFQADELILRVAQTPKCIRPPDFAFQSAANAVVRRWQATGLNNTDNPTLAIKRIRIQDKPDYEERKILQIDFVRSSYRYDAIAKGPDGARFRWERLQEQEDAGDVLTHLSSGVGVAVNVTCLRDQTLVIGQRLNVNFRRGDFDVAAVEGIRPTANVSPTGILDLVGVVRRSLDEEIGLKHAKMALNRKPDEVLRQIKIFGFGVDLRYYQYNFLCSATLDASFADVEQLWGYAKDRSENKRLYPWPADREKAVILAKTNNIWSSGLVCLLKSFEYL